MTRERQGALAFILVFLVAAAAIAFAVSSRQARLSPRPAAERPTLLLLTSLPLVFGEQFSLQGGGSPALAAYSWSWGSSCPIGNTGMPCDAGCLED